MKGKNKVIQTKHFQYTEIELLIFKSYCIRSQLHRVTNCTKRYCEILNINGNDLPFRFLRWRAYEFNFFPCLFSAPQPDRVSSPAGQKNPIPILDRNKVIFWTFYFCISFQLRKLQIIVKTNVEVG